MIQYQVSKILPIVDMAFKGPLTYHHIKKTTIAGITPAWSNVKQKSIFVLPGPGRPWQMAKSS
jgi:hypothetical protein